MKKKDYPNIYDEWDYDKNEFGPERYSPDSTESAYFRCLNGHNYRVKILYKSRGAKCRYCNKNSISDICPEYAKEWDYNKNKYGPEKYSIGNNTIVHWKCSKNEKHKWSTTPNARTKSRSGCPFCDGRRVLKENSFGYLFPYLCDEWSPRNKKTPYDYSVKSNYYAEWICKKGHTWKTGIHTRTSGHGCPTCKGQRASKDNNLITSYPEIINWWDYEKNKLEPENYLPWSNKKVYFKCSNNHSICLLIPVFLKRVNKCHICAKTKIATKDYNLLFIYPDLCKEWDYEKNELCPSKITPHSHKKVWWKCKNGHSWKATIKNRVNGTCCPSCSHQNVSKAAKKWLKKLGIKKREIKIKPYRYKVDGLKDGIVYEYLGDFWHANPALYDPNKTHRVHKKPYWLVLYNTIQRLNKIHKLGYRIIYCWEHEEIEREYSPILTPKEEIKIRATEIYKGKTKTDILEEYVKEKTNRVFGSRESKDQETDRSRNNWS